MWVDIALTDSHFDKYQETAMMRKNLRLILILPRHDLIIITISASISFKDDARMFAERVKIPPRMEAIAARQPPSANPIGIA